MAIKLTPFLRRLKRRNAWMKAKLKISAPECQWRGGASKVVAAIQMRGSMILARLTDQDEVALFCDNKLVGTARWSSSRLIVGCDVVFDSLRETEIVLRRLTVQLRAELESLSFRQEMVRRELAR